jgi:hypothetical protein
LTSNVIVAPDGRQNVNILKIGVLLCQPLILFRNDSP